MKSMSARFAVVLRGDTIPPGRIQNIFLECDGSMEETVRMCESEAAVRSESSDFDFVRWTAEISEKGSTVPYVKDISPCV